jgi:hypothetical protein
MNNTEISVLFDSKFKFQINQSLRHKGDSKEAFSSDMGLLVLERHVIETEDDDGNRLYERSYVCRSIQFSGSGQLIRFSEKELMTVEEHEVERERVKEQGQRMRNEVRQMQKETYAAFGITEETILYLKDVDGNVDETKKYRVSGFSSGDGELSISLREMLMSLDKKPQHEYIKVTSKDQFQIVNQ